MPTPVWTAQYDFTQTPVQNGFTEFDTGSPSVTTTSTSLSVDSSHGDAVFVAIVPAFTFNPTVGLTAEATVAVSGSAVGIYPPDAGFELDFLGQQVELLIQPNAATISVSADVTGNQNTTVSTASNTAATVWRVTIDGTGIANVYRAGVLVIGPIQLLMSTALSEKFIFWGEQGAIVTFTELNYYNGGAVSPG